MNESDLLVVFGASFSNHTGITPKKPTIQIDFDPMAHGKFHKIDRSLLGEIGVTTQSLISGVAGTMAQDRRPEIVDRWAIWRKEKERREKDERVKGLSAATAFAVMNEGIR